MGLQPLMRRRNRGGSIWEEYGRNIFVERGSMIAAKAIGHMLLSIKTYRIPFSSSAVPMAETCALAAMVWTINY